jgi:formiminotetrahydrofolate cyclodeaminase
MTISVADQGVIGFCNALASDVRAPGAGAAGAVALALAAACAGKAVTISARHAPEDITLARIGGELAALRAQSLALATEDGALFEAHLDEDSPESAARLAECGERALQVAAGIEACCTAVAGRVMDSLGGDLLAAAALLQAGRRIQRRNLAETEAEGTAYTAAPR